MICQCDNKGKRWNLKLLYPLLNLFSLTQTKNNSHILEKNQTCLSPINLNIFLSVLNPFASFFLFFSAEFDCFNKKYLSSNIYLIVILDLSEFHTRIRNLHGNFATILKIDSCLFLRQWHLNIKFATGISV